jgi:hypothetical protein
MTTRDARKRDVERDANTHARLAQSYSSKMPTLATVHFESKSVDTT